MFSLKFNEGLKKKDDSEIILSDHTLKSKDLIPVNLKKTKIR